METLLDQVSQRKLSQSVRLGRGGTRRGRGRGRLPMNRMKQISQENVETNVTY